MKYCLIITAAGMSTRLGKNKLLMRIGNETVIEKTIKNVMHSDLEITVVIGHEKELIGSILNNRFGNQIKIVDNKKYKSGISSSIKVGLLSIGENCDYYGFCNGDKPFIKNSTVSLILKYLDKNRSQILVPLYQDEYGHPTFFYKDYFKDLQKLSGNIGGKEIINKYNKKVTYLPIDDEGILIDMDKYLAHE